MPILALTPGRHAYHLVTGQPRGNSKKQDRDNQDNSFPSHFHRMCFSEERDVVRVKSSSHLEIARVLVRFNHVASFIVNTNHSVMGAAAKLLTSKCCPQPEPDIKPLAAMPRIVARAATA